MSWLTNILGGSLQSILSGVGGVIDKFHLSPEEKQKFQLEMEALLQRRDSELEQTVRATMESKERVLVAELSQGDSYTKRARPSVVYVGLVFIFLVHVLMPMLEVLFGLKVQGTVFALPDQFWVAWGGIVATWSIGRSFERNGVNNRLTRAVTGSESPNQLEAKG